MKLTLDPEELREQMTLWRSAVDLRMDLRPDLRTHLIVRRRDILKNFEKTGSDWLTVLRLCKPAREDAQAHAALCADVEEFSTWAQAGLRQLDELAADEGDG